MLERMKSKYAHGKRCHYNAVRTTSYGTSSKHQNSSKLSQNKI